VYPVVAEVKQYSIEEYLAFANLPENEDKRFELVEGEIDELPPSSTRNTVIAGWYIFFFNQYLLENPIGYVSVSDGGFRMTNGNVRQPDAAYVSRARYPKLQDTVFPVAPDIAVEVVSPSETAQKVRDKVNDYLSSGTTFVWVAYPDDQSIDVHTLNQDSSITVRKLSGDESLDAGNVMPGFTLKMKRVFPNED
jgi:Uma2 family endonuclease